MKVLAIVISYNFERWMDRCLCSLRASDLKVDVMVIDNGSQDKTVERIRKDYPEVRLIQNSTNVGFGRANNIGMKIALEERYDFVFLLNQDAWIDPNTVATLVALSELHPEFGILSPVHLTGKGDRLDFGFADYAHLQHKTDVLASSYTEVSFVNAAFWLIPVRVLREVGGFSSLFYHCGEDLDFTNRLRYHGYKIVYAPVFGYHDREKRAVTKPMEYRAKTVYLFAAYANINHSFDYCFVKAIGGGCEQVAKALRRRAWKDAAIYLKVTAHLLSQSIHICAIRKSVARKAPTFILP